MDKHVTQNAQFRGATVHLDGKLFENCTFTECELIFSGEEHFVLAECALVNCAFNLAGPARRTIEQLSALYHFGYAEIVEHFFQAVREQPTEPAN